MNSMNTLFDPKSPQPYIRIVEQPARSSVRFRYECEGRSAGPIPGVNSSPSCATYPTIQIINYLGSRAMVVVSCVTVSQPYRQHPHHLVGRVGCHNGICSLIVDNSDHLCTFTHLGIQCAKRNEISSRLKLRKQLQIDPTFGGFDHITKTTRGVDLGCVRLCFQVFLEGPEPGKFCLPLEPVVSDPVYDKKLLSKLTITDISTNSTVATGGKVMLFCNYIDEGDIEVLFFECNGVGLPIWQSFANLKPPFGEVHKRVGMSFMSPPYKNTAITDVVKCYMQLRRISDQEASDPIIFYYLPINPQHNCPFIEHYITSCVHNLSVCPKKVKSNKSYFNSDINTKKDSNDCTTDNMKTGVGNLIKFEDIDSQSEVMASQNKSVHKCVNPSDALLIKNEIIENPLNDESMNAQIAWNIPNEQPINSYELLGGQSNVIDEDNSFTCV